MTRSSDSAATAERPAVPPSCHVARLEARRGDRIGIVGPNGAGKTTLLRTIAGELPPLEASSGSAPRCSPATSPRSASGRCPGATVLDALLAQLDLDDGPGARVPGALPLPRRRRLQARRGAVGRRAVAARAGAARRLARQPAAPRRADEPPRHPGPRGARDVPARVAGDGARRLPRPAAARERSASGCGSSSRPVAATPGRRGRRSTAAIARGALRSPTAGRWQASSSPGRDGWTRSRRPVGARAAPAGGSTGPIRPAAARRPHLATVARSDAGGLRDRVAATGALSKDAYRASRSGIEGDLTRLGLRRNHLELALGDPAVPANFVELRRVTSELAGRGRGPGPGRGRLAGARGAGAAMTGRAVGADSPIVGLTGPIGCGKSTVAAMLGELGWTWSSTPTTWRDVATAPGRAGARADPRRGSATTSSCRPGSLDRPRPGGGRVRGSGRPARPRGDRPSGGAGAVEARARGGRDGGRPFVAIEAIKLVEGGLAERCDETWLVECDRPSSGSACAARPPGGRSSAAWRHRARLATRLDERLGHDPIDGSARPDPESLRERVEDALADWLDPVFQGSGPRGRDDRR